MNIGMVDTLMSIFGFHRAKEATIKKRVRLNDEQREQVVKLYAEQKATARELARAYNIGVSTVHSIIRRSKR